MTDDQRLVAKIWAFALFHGGVEGVAIDVGNAEAGNFRVGEQPPAAAPIADLGWTIKDLAAIPAQDVRHGSDRSSFYNSRQRAPEMPPPCVSNDAYYVSRRRPAGRSPCIPALQ